MRPGGILTLDISTETGFCYGWPGDDEPLYGAWILPKHVSRGAVGSAFEDALDTALMNLRPCRLVYEAPLPPNLQSDREGAFYTMGLAFMAEACAHRAEVPVRSRRSDQVRGAVIGRVYLTDEEKAMRPRPTVKSAIVAPWIKTKGWDVTNHNAADAVVIWAYEVGMRHPGFNKRNAA